MNRRHAQGEDMFAGIEGGQDLMALQTALEPDGMAAVMPRRGNPVRADLACQGQREIQHRAEPQRRRAGSPGRAMNRAQQVHRIAFPAGNRRNGEVGDLGNRRFVPVQLGERDHGDMAGRVQEHA